MQIKAKLKVMEVTEMKMKNPMLVVTDIEKSVEFYKKVFGLHVIMDFGANKTLTGGLALQTVETYKDFIGKSDISFGGNNFEIYFEEDNLNKKPIVKWRCHGETLFLNWTQLIEKLSNDS